MALDLTIKKRLSALLRTDDRGTPVPRLEDDARRLFERVRWLLGERVTQTDVPLDALELACAAWQLPHRVIGTTSVSSARTSVRQHAVDATETFVTLLGTTVGPDLTETTTRLLTDATAKPPTTDSGRVFSDALALGEFGLDGLLAQALLAGVKGQGVGGFVTALEKRDIYGYWDARLNDGFHFEKARATARERLGRVREIVRAARAELGETK